MTREDREIDKLIDEMIVREEFSMAIYGFYVHAVVPCEHHPNDTYNVHTHGLDKTRNHRDLQIVLPIAPSLAHKLIWDIVNLIDNKGFKCVPGKRCSELLEGMDVEFMLTQEDGRDVIRILLPDKNGKLPSDKDCDEAFRHQTSIDTDECHKNPNRLLN